MPEKTDTFLGTYLVLVASDVLARSRLPGPSPGDGGPPVTAADNTAGRIGRVNMQIVGIGGSVDTGSQSEAALRAVLTAVQRRGAQVRAFTGPAIDLPPYFTGADIPSRARDYIEAVRSADAVVISSPGYHGSISGVLKNALDYLEELRSDNRPYLDGRAVGLVAVARGWQASVNTLAGLRQVVHALRGWPTPYGVTVNSGVTRFDENNRTTDQRSNESLELMAGQMVDFASKMGTGTQSHHRPAQ